MDGLAAAGPEALVLMAVALAGAAAVAGVLAGVFGVGGGIVLVPILFHVFTALGVDEAVRMHLAVGTSLATIIPTSIRSLSKHSTHDAVDWTALQRWAVPVILGVGAGTLAASVMAGASLSLLFASLAFLVGLYLACAPEEMRIADRLPGPVIMSAIGGVIGFVSTLMGIGGGTFGVAVMTLYGAPIHRAVGTASGLGLIISVPASLGFVWAGWGEGGLPPLSLGFVNLLAFAVIVPVTWMTVPWGVALAHSLSRTLLRRAFAAFLILNVGLMAYETVG